MLRIQHAVFRGVDRVDLRIFRVEVINRGPKLADCRDNINALPEEMARVKVCLLYTSYSYVVLW